jgi:hypothetical protein
MLAAIDHDSAVDDHRADAGRILVRVVVGRTVDDRVKVRVGFGPNGMVEPT